MGWYIFVALAALVINIVISIAFAKIAEEKGYEMNKYLLICIFFGVTGYIWVAALPDLTLHERISRLESNRGTTVPSSAAASPANASASETTTATAKATFTEDGRWICGNCQTENSMNYGQCKKCGKYRG